jgi:AraC-like DNA-binding protein
MPAVIKMLDSEFKEIENWKRKIHMTKTVNPDEMYTHASTLLCICLNMLSCKTTYSNSNFPAWFNSILDHINSSEFMECTVQDIYKLSNFSPPLIINAFKKYLGVTPVKYLTEVKMNYVCNLLKNTDFSILAICERVGYDSLSHFNRVFKKTKGKTPTEYRLSFKAKN